MNYIPPTPSTLQSAFWQVVLEFAVHVHHYEKGGEFILVLKETFTFHPDLGPGNSVVWLSDPITPPPGYIRDNYVVICFCRYFSHTANFDLSIYNISLHNYIEHT